MVLIPCLNKVLGSGVQGSEVQALTLNAEPLNLK